MNHAKCQQEWHNNESEHTATTLYASAWIICSLGGTSYKTSHDSNNRYKL